MFVEDDGYTVVAVDDPVHVQVEDLDARLLAVLHKRGVRLCLEGAPLPSWVLARLEHLAHGPASGPPSPAPIEVIDDAVFVRDYVAVDHNGAQLGKLQVQGGMIGVGVLGVQARAMGPRLVDGLVAAIAAAPGELRAAVVQVRDPDWLESPGDYLPTPTADHVNAFGWDGERFVGEDNVTSRRG